MVTQFTQTTNLFYEIIFVLGLNCNLCLGCELGQYCEECCNGRRQRPGRSLYQTAAGAVKVEECESTELCRLVEPAAERVWQGSGSASASCQTRRILGRIGHIGQVQQR